MRKLGLQAVVTLSVAGIAFACASEPPNDFVGPDGSSSSSGGSTVPGGDGGGSSSGGSSGGSSSGASSGDGGGGDSAVAGNCSNHAAVSDKPACDTCTKAKCCKEIQACDNSAACKTAQDCLAKCKSDDFGCGLECYVAAGNGSDLLTAVGQCASSQCPNDCGGGGFGDGGFDFDAF